GSCAKSPQMLGEARAAGVKMQPGPVAATPSRRHLGTKITGYCVRQDGPLGILPLFPCQDPRQGRIFPARPAWLTRNVLTTRDILAKNGTGRDFALLFPCGRENSG